MEMVRFRAFVTEGLGEHGSGDWQVVTALNGEDYEMRITTVPDLVSLALKCARMGLEDVQIEVDKVVPGALLITFPGAVDAEFPALGPLSPREQQVAELLALGKTNREIAQSLSISVKTVDSHRGHALKKLGLRNNSELTRFAVRTGLVPA